MIVDQYITAAETDPIVERIPVPDQFSLRMSAAPAFWYGDRSARHAWIDDALIVAETRNGAPVVRRVYQSDTGTLGIERWGGDESAAAWVSRVLRPEDVLPTVPDQVIASLLARFAGMSLYNDGSLFEGLVTSIAGQSISLASAAAIQWRLARLVNPDVVISGRPFCPLPDARQLAEMTPANLREIGLTTKRGEGLINIAREFMAGNLPDDDVDRNDPDGTMIELVKLPMVGKWTAASTLLWGTGAADVYPPNDVALLRAARFAYGKPNMTMKELDALSDSWRPARAVACRLLWANLLGVPGGAKPTQGSSIAPQRDARPDRPKGDHVRGHSEYRASRVAMSPVAPRARVELTNDGHPAGHTGGLRSPGPMIASRIGPYVGATRGMARTKAVADAEPPQGRLLHHVTDQGRGQNVHSETLEHITAESLETEAWVEGARVDGGVIPRDALINGTIDGCTLTGVSLAERSAHRLAIVGSTLSTCDLSNATLEEARFTRTTLEDCKLTGTILNGANLKDVTIRDCQAPLVQFQSGKARKLVFERCRLQGAFFNGSDLTGTIFNRCDLTDADFTNATLAKCDLRGSTLDGIHLAPEQLRGVIVTPDQALYLSRAMGLVIKD